MGDRLRTQVGSRVAMEDVRPAERGKPTLPLA